MEFEWGGWEQWGIGKWRGGEGEVGQGVGLGRFETS